ncbi:MAG: ATP-binding protein [Dorea sp.]|nr:ATP-binding protein [Dorea sp.]
MKSTLYLKFILLYIVFGFLSIFIVATLNYNLTSEPIREEGISAISSQATMMCNDYFPDFYAGNLSLADIRLQMKGMATQMEAAVWLADIDGNVLASSEIAGYPHAPAMIDDFDPGEIRSYNYIEGNYHGYFDESVCSFIIPIVYRYSPKGYLLIHKFDSSFYENIWIFQRASFVTLFVIFLLSFIFLLGFHLFVYKPLSEITEAAKQYAQGNMKYQIPIRSSDEMGYLSASLNYMSSQIKDMEDYRKKFVGNVSHDFRSPLTSIRGYVEAMVDGVIPPEFHEKYLKIILFETERLTDLTRDLLTLNEFDTKSLIINKEVFELHEMIKNVATSFEGQCSKKKISIDLLFASKLLYVNADKSKIQQVLYNLLDNAIKFSSDNSTITIETTIRGDKVVTTVKDEGEGIPRASLNKIWDRFYKTDASRGKDKKGTGLGLAIVKEAITAHGENINVISTEGVGTEFYFTLPKAR